VGGELLDQIARQRHGLERDYDVALSVVGIADSRRTLFDESGVDLAGWRDRLAIAPPTGPIQIETARGLIERLGARAIPVLVDLTAADGMELVHAEAFRHGVHVVTANKRPLSVPWRAREEVSAARKQGHRQYHYETTVGAALPVIDTLKSLVQTGDSVHRIEGSISGTLGFVTSEVMKGAPLSLSVRWARELGYTEADPRDDLSGLDTARKAIILARELGYHVDLEDVRIDSLVPAARLAPGSLQDLYQALREEDDAMAERCRRLRQDRRVLRYVAHIVAESGRATVTVGPAEVREEHRAARLQGIEAYVAFKTDRHAQVPLVVQGAGVGGALTAGAVLAEIFKVAAGHGAR
jgi:homoserine dehydrogenase